MDKETYIKERLSSELYSGVEIDQDSIRMEGNYQVYKTHVIRPDGFSLFGISIDYPVDPDVSSELFYEAALVLVEKEDLHWVRNLSLLFLMEDQRNATYDFLVDTTPVAEVTKSKHRLVNALHRAVELGLVE